MSFGRLFLLAAIILGALNSIRAEQNLQRVSFCTMQKNPESFLHTKVEVRAIIFMGFEMGYIKDEKCLFHFAFGDDYQTFGDRFPVKHDAQWDLMKKLLGTTECASNVRVAKATIKGIVIRVPATGTIPPDEMPLELVIQSVSKVVHVPIRCTPSRAHSGDTRVGPAR